MFIPHPFCPLSKQLKSRIIYIQQFGERDLFLRGVEPLFDTPITYISS